MAKIGLNLKIDVTKIDKLKLFKGAKGTYLDAQIFVDLAELDQYGNSGMITQVVSKEERQAGQQGAILGNGKIFWNEDGQAPQQAGDYQQAQANHAQQQAAPHQQQAPAGQEDFSDDIPF